VLRFSLSPALAPLVTDKGSIAVDGVSLTVSAVGDDWFEVSLIPETLSATTLGERSVGELVNIETDILARHVQRMLRLGLPEQTAGRPRAEAPGSPQATPSHETPHERSEP
jgi:riboflavin synthase